MASDVPELYSLRFSHAMHAYRTLFSQYEISNAECKESGITPVQVKWDSQLNTKINHANLNTLVFKIFFNSPWHRMKRNAT